MITEGAGAASLAAALEMQEEGKNIACIITGANIENSIVQDILKKPIH
jgi:threonine dehydratase